MQRRLTALGCGILHTRLLQVGPQLHEEDAKGVDDSKDDPVAEKAAGHHQPRLKEGKQVLYLKDDSQYSVEPELAASSANAQAILI